MKKTTKVLLISANTESINMPVLPVGLAAVAAAARNAGHDVEMLDLLNVKDTDAAIEAAVEKLRPEIIGVSIRNIDDQKADSGRLLLDQVKPVISGCRRSSKAAIVVGGAGYSIFPESVLSYLGADMGIQGEGEVSFPMLIDLLRRKGDLSKVPGLYLPGRGLQGERRFARNLDLLPQPDSGLWRSLAAGNRLLWMPVQTRRGCPMCCSYCSTPVIEGRVIRKRTPETVVDALLRHVENGFRQFFFTDNTFNMPPDYARRLCRMLAERRLDISWRCILYPGFVDESLVEEMARAGCKEVSMGFESGSGQMLKNFNKRFSPGTVRRTAAMLARRGIGRMGFLLLGGPGESKDSVEESLAFADSLALEAVKVTIGIRIYPHTALAEQAVKEGIITADDDLLMPRFYLKPQLEGWLRETVNRWMKERPNWVA